MDVKCEKKPYLRLLQAVVRNTFFADPTTDEEISELVAEVASIDAADALRLISASRDLIKDAAFKHTTVAQIEPLAKKAGCNEERAGVVAHVWKSERQKVHDSLMKASVMDNSLAATSAGGKPIAWRLDLKAQAKGLSAEGLNQPSAIIQLRMKDHSKINNNADEEKVVQFEANREQIDNVMAQITAIKSRLSDFNDQ